jgi:Tol biopolymer transport system component
VQHCLEKDPGDRFQSARDLGFDLQALTGVSSAPSATAAGAARGVRRVRAVVVAAIVLAAATLGAGLFLVGRVTKRPPEPPTYKRLTFQRGFIKTARFTPDGKSVLYSAEWDGRPAEIFETRTDLATTRSLGLTGAHLHAVSRNDELAVKKVQTRFGSRYEPLSVVPRSGSGPRDLLEEVACADWAPDGTTLAVVRRNRGQDVLEMPPGRVLVQTSGALSDVRVSPDGRRVAFTEHPVLGDSRGTVAVVDVEGRKATLTREFTGAQGIAWSPDGREIWFSASAEGMQQSLLAVTPGGRLRTVARFPSAVVLHDLAQDGRVLLASQRGQSGIRGRSSPEEQERELGWLDWPWPRALSADGRWLLFDDQGETAGPSYTIYLRNMDGSPPVRLGEGAGCALSPDGRWALAIHYAPPPRLILIPTGSGDTLSLPSGQVETYQSGSFLPDGHRIMFVGAERGHPQRTWVQELPGGLPSAVTPEGVSAGIRTSFGISPDGRWLAAVTRDFTLMLFPLVAGEPRAVAKLTPAQEVSQWSEDGRTLFVSCWGTRLDVFGVDVQSGERRLWKSFEVPDPAGVAVPTFIVTRDGRGYAYGYVRFLDELYLVEGLR